MNKKSFIIGFISSLILCITVGVSATRIMKADEISYSSELTEANNVQDAISELMSIDPQVNWTLVLSYNTYLGWNGNNGYGAAGGKVTIKKVGDNITVTNSGGANNSPTDNWNGRYWINSSTSDFKVVSFTIDE